MLGEPQPTRAQEAIHAALAAAAGLAVSWAPWSSWPTAWGPMALALALLALVAGRRLGLSRAASRPWVLAAFALALAAQGPGWPAELLGPLRWVAGGLALGGLLALLPPWQVLPWRPRQARIAQRLRHRLALGRLDEEAFAAAWAELRPGWLARAWGLLDGQLAWPALATAALLAWGGGGEGPWWALMALEWLAWWRASRCRVEALAWALDEVASPPALEAPWADAGFDSPLRLGLGAEAAEALVPRRLALAERLSDEEGLLGQLGLALHEALRRGEPWPAWLGPEAGLAPQAFALRVHGQPVAEGELRAGLRWARAEGLGLEGQPAAHGHGLWLAPAEAAAARRRGLDCLGPEAVVALAMIEVAQEQGEALASSPSPALEPLAPEAAPLLALSA